MSLLHTPAPVLRGDRRLDLYIIVALSLATLATRLPLMPSLIANADGAGYAFGMDHFDPLLQHPHPPGCPLFVLCARLLRLFTGDANHALVLMNIIPAAIAVPALYWLGRRMFSRAVGLTAAVLLLTCPNYWRTNLMWMAYAASMCLSVLTANALWGALQEPAAARRRRWRPALVGALLVGLAGNFRQQTLLFLAPMWAWTALRRSWWQLAAGLGVVAACTAGWVVWAAQATGSFERYRAATDAQWREVVRPTSLGYAFLQGGPAGVVTTLGQRGHLWLIFLFGGGTHATAWAWGALCLYALLALGRGKKPFPGLSGAFLGLWIALLAGVSLTVYVNSQCHVVEDYPPLFLIAGVGLQQLVRDLAPFTRPGRHTAIVLIAICGLFNATLFMRATYPDFAGEVAQVGDVVATIRHDFSSPDTVLIQSDQRGQCYAFEYNLPEYRFYMLEPTLNPSRPSLEDVTGVHSPLQLGPQVRHVVFVSPAARVDAPTRTVVSARGMPLLKVAEVAPESTRLYFDKEGVRFGR